jgi:hypothetical protein
MIPEPSRATIGAGVSTPARPHASPHARLVPVLAAAIRLYQLTISPAQLFLFGAGSGCRFTPPCSAYALEAVRGHGALAGTWLAAKRVCRCQPWGGCGHDPVPPSGKAAVLAAVSNRPAIQI